MAIRCTEQVIYCIYKKRDEYSGWVWPACQPPSADTVELEATSFLNILHPFHFAHRGTAQKCKWRLFSVISVFQRALCVGFCSSNDSDRGCILLSHPLIRNCKPLSHNRQSAFTLMEVYVSSCGDIVLCKVQRVTICSVFGQSVAFFNWQEDIKVILVILVQTACLIPEENNVLYLF